MSRLARVLDKKWTAEQVTAVLGSHLSTHLTHATDADLRSRAASGGTVTALLISELESGRIDGALVCTTTIDDGRVRPLFEIATTPDALLDSRGSVYIATRFAREALPLIRSFHGRLAVVGLPCDLTLLRKTAETDCSVADTVVLTIGLLCGHSSTAELTDLVTRKLERKAGSALTGFRHKMGHWRGSTVAEFENGETIEQPFKRFGVYQNLYLFADTKCMYCGDHFAYDADVCAGDIWRHEMKSEKIKSNCVVVRTEAGQRAFQNAVGTDTLTVHDLSPQMVLNGQVRTAPFHYNVSARSRAGKLFGMRIPDRLEAKVRVHEYLAAVIALANYRMTRSATGRRIAKMIPRPLLTASVYVLKGLQSLK